MNRPFSCYPGNHHETAIMATAESRYLLRIAETRIWHSGFHFLSNNGEVIENHSVDAKTCVTWHILLLLLCVYKI